MYSLSEQCSLDGFSLGFSGFINSLGWSSVCCLLMDSFSFLARVFLVCLAILCLVSFLILSPCSSISSLLLFVRFHADNTSFLTASHLITSIKLCVSVCWQSFRFGVTAVMLPQGFILFLPFVLFFLLLPTIISPFQCVKPKVLFSSAFISVNQPIFVFFLNQ